MSADEDSVPQRRVLAPEEADQVGDGIGRLMTGNGPMNSLKTPGGTLFAAVDALIGKAVYVLVVAVLFIPVVP